MAAAVGGGSSVEAARWKQLGGSSSVESARWRQLGGGSVAAVSHHYLGSIAAAEPRQQSGALAPTDYYY
eukprot:CAMPEP_0171695250 /NCGR_PEP_ID=MMETSP0991-20121206/7662_1 /TAXON_ID=483369 /ORGANISM="non described non described, Strain CCMP2098" /LENGTH=68 /DNA_ID=CAMNT_0012283913 /DNA_START=676 /DNA_END=883 /DNA_ORIENTATION=-